MDTPIVDFVRNYDRFGLLRLHMPGHKGVGPLGCEHLDITEVADADNLYAPEGIILRSEQNASELFGAHTVYSTEGSSQCIRAMLHLAAMHARRCGRKPLIAAGRNAHKAFLSAAALLDLDILWLYPQQEVSYLSCRLTAEDLEQALRSAPELPTAVYLTSPDYLGNITDIAAMAKVCHAHGILLLVDNAHGAYLRFLSPSRHPMDLGADLCCDSAHKTLGVVTGGAYLHISRAAPAWFAQQAKDAMALFGSTSPSYLILQSLDAVNATLAEEYPRDLAAFLLQLQALRQRLEAHGYTLLGDEPLKLTIDAKAYGYTGALAHNYEMDSLADHLLLARVVCEFADPDFVVLMVTPQTGTEGLARLERTLCAIPRRSPITVTPPTLSRPKRVLSVRQAALSPSRYVDAACSEGYILSAASVGCPPAVPIVACGERIDRAAVDAFAYYGITNCCVVEETE